MTLPHDDSTAPQRPAERPRPAYGELAPEGREWTPEPSDPVRLAEVPTGATGVGSPVSGVPHNLGARSGSSGSGSPASGGPAPAAPETGRADPEPYRGQPQEQRQQYAQQPQQPTAGAAPSAPAPKPRLADRIITIILLVLGAFGSLNFAGSMLGLPASLSLIAGALELSDFTVPSWVGTVGTVSAVVIIAIYAVNLIFSIQRMRARKLAFWVPLTAGAVVMIGTIVVTSVVLMSFPELMTAVSDPSSTQKLLDSLTNLSQP